ncbi:MAG: AMP-binding protein [Alphaproteobacteria bacterium]|nr:AMP-binding protein [Alphaproteobacteria bacterium]
MPACRQQGTPRRRPASQRRARREGGKVAEAATQEHAQPGTPQHALAGGGEIPPGQVAGDTFPKLLAEHVRLRGDRTAIREKAFGIWQSWTWRQVQAEVTEMAAGLAVFGLQRGDKLAIVGDNRPQLYWTFAAVQSLGGIAVPVYQDAIASEMAFVLDHADARFAVVENQEQVDKLLAIMDRLPKLERIFYSDPRGLRHYEQPFLLSLERLKEEGRAFLANHPGHVETEAAAGRGSDIAVFCYTSGTTGNPKGVMLSHDNLIRSARLSAAFDGLSDKDEILAYLPMAWVGDHYFSYGQAFVTGFVVNCPESSDTVMTDLKELGPTYFFAPPRIFETILTQVMIRMEDAGWIKRRLFNYFLNVARRAGLAILEGRPVPPADRLLYWLGELLIYGPLKNTLGFSRIRVAYTAGEAIGPDIFDFFRSLGVNLKQLYGQTESTVYICLQTNDDVKADTVGPPAPGVEIRITEAGEVIYRSPGVFVGYYKNDEATRSTKTEDGWVHTGDAGIFTKDGHLKIIDRAKDVGRLNGGSLFAPKYIENKLKFFPYISEAVAFGHGRDFVACFINIDLNAVGNWAERRNLAYASYTDLAGKPEVYELIRGNIEQVNADLAADPALAGSQVRRFLILHKELDADDGELTRTRKVRRGTIAERYAKLIDALYDGSRSVEIEARVSFEDGRTGLIRADLRIEDAKVFETMRKAG